MIERDTLKINDNGHLEIGGIDAVELAQKYGTPLYVMDEQYIRDVCAGFTKVLHEQYQNALVCFASKAFSCTSIYSICDSMGLGADVVSKGELLTALQSKISSDKIYFHGNNKTIDELELAVLSNVHAVVVDSIYEIDILNDIAKKQGKVQKVLVRVNPGIDAHTHHFIQTTRVDSKFGFSISDGTALDVIKYILTKNNLHFAGVHCHIGSQIFELTPFELAVEKMTDFIKVINNETNVVIEELNMGGGYGIRYTSEDKPLKPYEYVQAIVNKLLDCIQTKKISKPRLILEPGRSIVGEAGVTLYTVGSIKNIKNVKKYISVNGGMFENPRYALYEAKYEAVLASDMRKKATQVVTIAGKCCESGDMLVCDTNMPEVKSGDILAVLSTGAYNYSMASNYNRNLIPPVVLVNKGQSDYIVKPQSYEDLLARDNCPNWLGGK